MNGGAYVGAGVAARWLGISRRTAVVWLRRGTLAGRRECGAGCLPDPTADDGCSRCRYYVFREPLQARLDDAKREPPPGLLEVES